MTLPGPQFSKQPLAFICSVVAYSKSYHGSTARHFCAPTVTSTGLVYRKQKIDKEQRKYISGLEQSNLQWMKTEPALSYLIAGSRILSRPQVQLQAMETNPAVNY
jgi:hypothetical protein